MKLRIILILTISVFKLSFAQVLCVQCFQQNNSVYSGSNNLILNGGFENTTCGLDSRVHSFCPNSNYYNCDITNWVCTGGGHYTYAYFWDTLYYVAEGTRSAYFGNGFCNVCASGAHDTACLSNSGCIVTGLQTGYPYNPDTTGTGGATGVSLSQTVSGLTINHNYLLEFWAGGEDDNLFTKDGIFAVDVGFGNIFLKEKTTVALTGIGTRFLIQFKANSTSHTIKFTNWGHMAMGTGCTELVIDDVRLFSLPTNVIPCTIGIDEFDENTLTISPNPFSSEATITFIEEQKYTSIKIFDIVGKEIKSVSFSGKECIIEKGDMQSGIYFVQVTDTKRNVFTKKLLVE